MKNLKSEGQLLTPDFNLNEFIDSQAAESQTPTLTLPASFLNTS
jgi:hypothetical protein